MIIIIGAFESMNHPSDYMNNFQDDASSDSSDPTIKITPTNRPTPSRPHHKPPLPLPHNNHKPNRPLPAKKNRPSKAPTGKKRSCSDYLILGDSYITSAKAREITRRLMEQQRQETPRVMRVQRLKRKEEACIHKVEAYIQTFVQGLRISHAIRTLAKPKKIALYELLKAEERQWGEGGEGGEEGEGGGELEGYFRLAMEKLERVSSGIQEEFPSKQRVISRWKNLKLHQLSSVQSFLTLQQQQECDWEAELAFLADQKFFPELKRQAEELSSSIATLLRHQEQSSTTQQDAGVKWVLQRLLKFILEREEVVNGLLQRLQQSVCPLLDDRLFILFEREVIGSSEDQSEAQEQRYIHMFNKAIFDLVNQAATHLLPHCHYSAVDDVIAWLFQSAPKYQREELEGDCLLGVGEAVFEGLLEEALWDFLEYL